MRYVSVTRIQLIQQNFVQYIMNDVLGQVDNTHLALSDLYDPFHPDCLHLSEVHSVSERTAANH